MDLETEGLRDLETKGLRDEGKEMIWSAGHLFFYLDSWDLDSG